MKQEDWMPYNQKRIKGRPSMEKKKRKKQIRLGMFSSTLSFASLLIPMYLSVICGVL